MVELIFIHLPKTGGSSLLQLLYDQYGEAHVRHFERDECLELNAKGMKISEVLSPEVRAIHGHFFYKEVKDLVKRDKAKVITFMRHPVERVVSNYNWWMHTIERDENHSQRHRINEPLEVYMAQPDVRNKVSQFLDGIRLSQFAFIGFLENLDDDVKKLAKLLGWKDARLVHEKNSKSFRSGGQIEITPELRKAIERLHSKDVRLYERAKSLAIRF